MSAVKKWAREQIGGCAGIKDAVINRSCDCDVNVASLECSGEESGLGTGRRRGGSLVEKRRVRAGGRSCKAANC